MLKEIEKAAQRLRNVIHITPFDRSRTFSEMAGCDLYLKYENQQKTGSFKIRGAYNKLAELSETGNVKEVVASSAGNHAQGVAYAASKLGMKSTIVMPASTPIAKIKATEGYGASVILYGNSFDDALAKAHELHHETEAEFIHPFDDPSVIAGQGTIGAEILSALPDVDIVFIPAGGGGLLAGVACYLKNINPRVKIIGVQAEGANAIAASFKEKQRKGTQTAATIADGIAVKMPGELSMEMIIKYADDVITVSDAEISAAILHLLERSKQMVEPAGAASLAGALSGKIEAAGKKCVCVLSGGNIDVSFINRIIETGLVARNRKLRFRAILPDVPGAMEKVARIAAVNSANIVEIQYDRLSANLNPQDVVIHMVCEVADKAHGERVLSDMEKNGYKVTVE